jgi:nicotinate-nucleotide adenylyltransferase
MKRRIGLFGGSFDPIHHGHLMLAELCREALQLDQVRFLVANISPLKTNQKTASNRDRIEMVKLAIGGNPYFELDTREIDRGGISYTLDSVRSIQEELLRKGEIETELFLLMGADVLKDIAKWHQPKQLFQLITPCVISRGGFGEPAWEHLQPFVSEERLSAVQRLQVTAPQVDISSTNLRARVREGQSIRYQVPPSVNAYLLAQSLYKESTEPNSKNE